MSSEDDRAAFIEDVIVRARERWRGAVPPAHLEPQLQELRVLLYTHPVAMEYVARAMPRQPPRRTEERGDGGNSRAGGRAVGDD